jgi:hypothetical protein
VADSFHADDVSSLARDLAARVEALCPHVPAGELAELTSRLALSEHAHATGVSLVDDEQETAPTSLGNRIVWLPGSASAIVLPAGDDASGAGAAVRVVTWARRVANPLHGFAARGSAALRQLGSALASAYQERPHTE